MSEIDNERELIELAAKACGIPGSWSAQFNAFHIAPHLRGQDGERARYGLNLRHGLVWCPQHDDGDALRLAAKLRIDVEWETEWVVFADGNWSEDIKDHDNDAAAATRRAIVRAAAHRAESMP